MSAGPPPPSSRDPDADAWPAFWRSLGWFAVARMVVAAVLIAYVPVLRASGGLDARFDAPTFVTVAVGYLFAALAFVVLSRPRWRWLRLRPFAIAQVGVDIAVLLVLIHAAGPAHASLAVLLILPNAGAAILAGARIGLFLAAVSTLLLLAETGWRWLDGDASDSAFVQVGVLGAALLATAVLLGRLATRLAAQEQLAWRRGEDLRNQLAVTQAVIGELPDGVVVLGARGEPRAINRSAREMLAGAAAPDGKLPGLPSLRAALSAPSGRGGSDGADVAEFVVPGPPGGADRRVRARRVASPAGGADAVVVLEDLDRLEARAQQLKLASMGRLSASIAHEIRNPLSAIRHANGLLAEQLDGDRLRRLATIVEDNCRRIDRVIEDVLSISRRGGATPEPLPAGDFLSQAIVEHVAQSGVDARRIECRVLCDEAIWFDAGNLRQVLLNLLANALRHASGARGAVGVEWGRDPSGRCALVVDDDGPGVPAASRVHLFEPFFTTEARGTGLGLHLARELCTANGATIRYRPASDNPRLRSGFVVEPASPPPR